MPPAQRETLTIDSDGAFTMWRSTGEIVGRFAGVVPDVEHLASEVAGARAVKPPTTPPLVMDATLDRLGVEGETLSISADDDTTGPWGELLTRCRSLLDDLRDQPSSALGIELGPASAPTLVQRGDETLRIELIQPAATLVVWRDGEEVVSVRGYADIIESVHAEPGWRLDIPVSATDIRPGDVSVVEVLIDIYDAELPMPVHVYTVEAETGPGPGDRRHRAV